MHILAIDVGGFTQDILLFDSSIPLENCIQIIMPSPTVLFARRIERATRERKPLLLTGVTMGGGPSRRAAERHLEKGLEVYATPDAARTFDDDLAEVGNMGVTIISPEEARRFRNAERLELKDLDLPAIRKALASFGIKPRLDGIAVAVQDHGAAPPGMSDRLFRFQHLRKTVGHDGRLEAFVYLSPEIPAHLTRMQAVAQSLDSEVPLLLMDTGPAAVLGALEDRRVGSRRSSIVVNMGNAHTLAFHLWQRQILGIFEHHTRMLDIQKLDWLIAGLIEGTLTQEAVFEDGGHGAFVLQPASKKPLVAVTGPRRALALGSTFTPYLANPHGSMMLAGCFGLIRGFAMRMESWREEIEHSLRK